MTVKIMPILEKVAKAVVITLLAFVLSFILMQPFSLSIATLISSNDRHDFSITDFYNIIADGRAVRDLDSDIVIVDINGADRVDLAMVLDILPVLEPRAVGLDVMFDEPRDSEVDSLLLSAIKGLPDMVMIVDVAGDKERNANTFHISERSFFADSLTGVKYGACNLPTKFEGGVVREFAVDYKLDNGGKLLSFPVAVASAVDSAAVKRLLSRDTQLETINYPSRTFRTVHWEDIADDPTLLRDKIVLIGALNNEGDTHATPPQRSMSGIEIHAYALATVLNDVYIDSLGSVGNLLIAFLLCFCMALVHVSLPPEFKALALRFIQIFLLYLIIRIGYYLFIDHRLIVDFSYTLLMMTFVLFACDIWFGLCGVMKLITKKRAARKRKPMTTSYEEGNQ